MAKVSKSKKGASAGNAIPLGSQPFLDSVNHYFDKAVRYLNIPQGILNQIKVCNSVYYVRFPVRVKGDVQVIEAWRAEHSHH